MYLKFVSKNFIHTSPVLPSSDLDRDVKWYEKNLGFVQTYAEQGYSVLHRDKQWLHLQWHAGTVDDPVLGGSVVKFFVKDIQPIFEELVSKEVVQKNKLRMNTPWGTHEFGLYDPNNNAIFFVQNAD